MPHCILDKKKSESLICERPDLGDVFSQDTSGTEADVHVDFAIVS